MTAIFGLWRFDRSTVDSDASRMDAALESYGADHRQIWRDSGLALGRRVHRILPEDRFAEPIDRGRRYAVVADVRLTERDDLVRQLELGRAAEAMSDAAIVAAALEAWSEQAFDRIYGSFAVAAWDSRDSRLLLARDPLGQKPLFFHSGDGFFAFASMPAGLHSIPGVPRGADLDSIGRFLALESLSPGKSHYRDIGRIMPGHHAVVTAAAFSQIRYWKPDLSPLRLASNDEYAHALGRELDRAVGAALRGVEGEVGAHLSSGFDSTAVATTAARLLAPLGGSVVAYTAAPREGYSKTFPHRGGDESIIASATAAIHPNMEHVVVRSDRTPMANLDRTASIYAAPVFNICNQSWYDAINDDAARRGIRVMLEASMGNSTISETGLLALPELARRGLLLSWLKLAVALRRNHALGVPAILWRSFRQWVPDRFYRWLVERRHGPLVSPSRFSPLRPEQLEKAVVGAARDSGSAASDERIVSGSPFRGSDNSVADRLVGLAADDSGSSWKGRLAHWNIDYRDPTADRRLVEFSLRVPVEQLIDGGQPRALLLKVLSDRAPRAVLDNRARGYQMSDWHELLDDARPLVIEEVARMEACEAIASIIDVDRLQSLLEKWPERGSEAWIGYDATIDYRCCLLRAISAASFIRNASEQER